VNYSLEPGGITAGGNVGESVDFDGSGGFLVRYGGMHGNGNSDSSLPNLGGLKSH